MWIMFAETIDPFGGVTGWAGTGLLGTVLAWLLLKHLPDKDKLITKLIEDKDRIINELVASFRSETAAERKECTENFTRISNSISHLTEIIQDQLGINRERRIDTKRATEN